MTTASASYNQGQPVFCMDPHHNAATWRDHYMRERDPGPDWGKGDPWKSRDMSLGKMINMCDLPQDCSLLACYLMRHGYEYSDVATIASFKSPYRAEVRIDGIRYAVLDSQIYSQPL